MDSDAIIGFIFLLIAAVCAILNPLAIEAGLIAAILYVGQAIHCHRKGG